MIRPPHYLLLISICFLAFSGSARAQADEICRESGETPTREIGRGNRPVPYVYGRIILKGLRSDSKPPRVTAIYSDSVQPATRQLIEKSGNYCFKKVGNGGTLVIDVDGVEAARKSVSDIGAVRQREDFEIFPPRSEEAAPPGVISAKVSRPTNEKTLDLYRKAADAEAEKHFDKAIEYVKEVLLIDAEDFIAWAKLGSLYLSTNALDDADAAFKKALSLKKDYVPAMLNIGILNALQNKIPAAIEMFQRAVVTDPTSARAYRLLGEAFLQNRQGSMGLAALDEALRLDPVGMAECHLLKARLYDLAGAKPLAAAEYKTFLQKVPDSPEKKKLEKYIKDNPGN